MSVTQSDVAAEFIFIDGQLIRRSTNRRGYLRPDGYVYVRLKGISYGEHRLVYLLLHGYMPEQVDHINGIRDDNRPENLREATNSQNSMNRKQVVPGRGCYWQPNRSRWMVQIGVDGKRITVGYRKTLDAAISLRKEAEAKYHGEYAALAAPALSAL